MRSHALLLKRSFKKVDHTKICNVAMPELELKQKSFYLGPAVSHFYLKSLKHTHLAPTQSCNFNKLKDYGTKLYVHKQAQRRFTK